MEFLLLKQLMPKVDNSLQNVSDNSATTSDPSMTSDSGLESRVSRSPITGRGETQPQFGSQQTPGNRNFMRTPRNPTQTITSPCRLQTINNSTPNQGSYSADSQMLGRTDSGIQDSGLLQNKSDSSDDNEMDYLGEELRPAWV